MCSVNPISIVLPTPFAVGPVNVYLFPGDALTLVDTGAKTRLTMEALRAALAQHGYTVADIRRLVITHAHVDHFGLAAQIVAESGAVVWTHPRNLYWLTDFQSEWVRRYDFYAEMFQESGLPEGLRQAVRDAGSMMTRFAESVPVGGLLHDGDMLALDGASWRVLHLPGHAGGLICLYEPQQRILLSSDHVLKEITSNPLLEPPDRGETARRRSLVDYLESLERTAGLDVDLTLPSHGEAIADLRVLIAERFRFHETRQQRILDLLVNGGKTAYQIAGGLFTNLAPLDTFLAMSEVIGHLDVLEMAGHVRGRHRDGLLLYSRS